MRAVLRTDGGARGNPGPAGAGFVLDTPEGERIAGGGCFLGETTNNIAEYRALLWGLEVALAQGVTELTVYSDSELLVRQMNGVYKVKHANLKPLFVQALGLVRRFQKIDVRHVRREENREADALANAAMDARGVVGDAAVPGSDPDQGSLF